MMASDDEARQKDLERKRLLEEIKKRAEEAEFKRLEEEEQTPSVSRKPLVSPSTAESPSPQVDEIREKLVIALDRGLAEKASGLLGDFSALAPSDPDLRSYQLRLAVLQDNQQSMKVKKRSPQRMREDAVRQREVSAKRIADHLEHASSNYQQEKYELALKDVDEVLALDDENDEALKLKEEIEKAQQLAVQIREEEARRKAEEAATAPPQKPSPAKPVKEGDPWGAGPAEATTQTVYKPAEEEAAEAARAKVPTIDRIAQQVLKVRVPLKPALTVVGVIALAVIAYLVIDAIQHAVFPPKYSLLVFPASTTAADGSLDYYAEGLTEEFINDISVVNDLRLIAPNTSLHFQDPRLHNAQTAKSLGASFYVEWSIDRLPEEVTLRISLHDTSSKAEPVWKSERKSSLQEIPAVRLELAKEVLTRMGVVLTPSEEGSLTRQVTSRPEGYDEYLMGRFLMRRGDVHSLQMALESFQRSIAGDSGFADAYASLGWVHILLYEIETDSSRSHVHDALQNMERAIKIDPRLPEAVMLLGMAHCYLGENEKAIQRLEEASGYAPGNAEVQRRLAQVALVSGRMDEALKAADRAASVDPKNIDSHTMLGLVRHYRGVFRQQGEAEKRAEFDSARISYDRGMSLSGDPSTYATTYSADVLVYLQRHEKAAEFLLDRIARMKDSYVDMYKLGRVYQSAGNPISQWKDVFNRALEVLRARLTLDRNDGVALSFLALTHTRLGEFKEAGAASTRALQVAPSNVDVLYNTARMYSLQKDNTQALTFLTKALERRYRLNTLLDMDFFNLRQESEYLSIIIR